MDALKALGKLGKGILSFVPGGGMVSAGLELAGELSGIFGGDVGKKIKKGAQMLSEGLEEAGKQPMSPEQQAQLVEAGNRHKERMRELDLADTQGGRDVAKIELASKNPKTADTRPGLLRLYGKASLGLVFLCVIVGVMAALFNEVTGDQGKFLLYLFAWAVSTVMGAFYMMYRIYTGKRTQEKMAEVGVMPEGLIDKLLRLKSGARL